MARPVVDGAGHDTPKRRQDRLQANNIRRTLKGRGGNALTNKDLKELLHTIQRTHKHGNFNEKDQAALRRMIKAAKNNHPVINQPGSMQNGVRAAKFNPKIEKTLKKLHRFLQPEDTVSPNSNKPGYGKGLGVYAPGHGTNKNLKPSKSTPKGKNRPAPKHGGKKHGKRHGGGPNTSTPGMIYYGLGDFPGISNKQVKTIVGQDINNQVRALAQQLAAGKDARTYDINKIKALYDRTQGDLNYVYGEANDAIQGQNQLINSRFNDNKGDINGIYNALTQQIGNTSDANQQAAMQEMARLGIQQSGMPGYQADVANMQNMANVNQANAQANIHAMQQNSNQAGSLLQSMSAASLASALGRAANAKQDSISQTRQDYRTAMNDIMGQITDVKRQRGQMQNELYSAMEQNAFQRYMEQQQADFNNQLAANQFNLDVSKLNSSNWLAKAKLKQQAAEAAARRRQNQQFLQMQKQGKANDNYLSLILGNQ